MFAAFPAVAGDELPKIAVYVAGGRDAGEDKAVMTLILAALIKSGRYEAVERSHDFVAQINREHSVQRSGAVDDNQITKLGVQAGVQFVCVADLAAAFGAYQVSARIIDVETAKVTAIGVAGSDMKSIVEMEILANDVVARMLELKGGHGESAAEKRMRERAEAERRKKVEIDRRKRAQARTRDENAVRRESEKADKVERRRLEKAEKDNRRESAQYSAKQDRDGSAWHFYSAGFGFDLGGFDGTRHGGGGYGNDISTVEYDGLLTFRKEDGNKWPGIDLMIGYYEFQHDSVYIGNGGGRARETKIYRGIDLAAFKKLTYISSDWDFRNWGCAISYGLAGYFGGNTGTGLGGGGRFEIIYRGMRFDEENDFLIFSTGFRLMYNVIFTKGEFLNPSFIMGVSYAF
jgi:hypothetical protein